MIKGKGMFTWILNRCEHGDMARLVEVAKRGYVSFLMPKMAHAIWDYGLNTPYLKNLFDYSHANDIKIVGWQFVFGNDPGGEARAAIRELKKYPYDGFVVNAEGAYKEPGKHRAARLYMDILRAEFPDMFIALSSYRYPSLHRPFPFNEFLRKCDANMPQIYWMQETGTVPHNVQRTFNEWASDEYVQKPLLPTGAAFKEHGWETSPGDVDVFCREMIKRDVPAFSFWEWYHARWALPHLWNPIKQNWYGDEELPPLPPDPGHKFPFTAIVTAERTLSVREGPGVSFDPPIDYLKNGDIVTVTEASGIWWKHGHNRWSSSNFMIVHQEVDPEPTIKERLDRIEKHLGL